MKSIKQYNFGDLSVAITDGTDLRGAPLRLPHMEGYAYQVS
jgi:hypothetical protein